MVEKVGRQEAQPNPNGWSRAEDVQGFTWHRGKTLMYYEGICNYGMVVEVMTAINSGYFHNLLMVEPTGLLHNIDPTLVNEYAYLSCYNSISVD